MPFLQKEPELPSFGDEPAKSTWWENFRSFVWETVKVVIISLAIIIPVRYFLIQPFYVQGASMEPNFFDNEYLIIDEISYRFIEIERGDIVVFHYPRDPKQFFIKRVIGLPGEQIIVKDSQLRIIDQAGVGLILNESTYIAADVTTIGNIDVTLGINEYYVLGDNRTSSLDSRSFGPIREADVIGKVWLRGWPLNRAKVFEQPIY